jgi:hypothetical protein
MFSRQALVIELIGLVTESNFLEICFYQTLIAKISKVGKNLYEYMLY